MSLTRLLAEGFMEPMKRKPRKSGSSPLSKNLRRLMAEKGITVREAAAMAGVSSSTVDDWRAGALPEDYVAVRRLGRALGVSFSFLLLGEEEDARPGATLTITEAFEDGGLLFDGFAKISIQRLVPRTKTRKED